MSFHVLIGGSPAQERVLPAGSGWQRPGVPALTAIASYLTDILQANDAGLLSAALGDIARARGMTEIAKAAGITREALYKALRPGSAPRFDTVNRVCIALGVRLVVQPLHPV